MKEPLRCCCCDRLIFKPLQSATRVACISCCKRIEDLNGHNYGQDHYDDFATRNDGAAVQGSIWDEAVKKVQANPSCPQCGAIH